MKKAAEESLASWVAEGLIDSVAAERVRDWEAARGPEAQVRWEAAIAWGLGALLIGAGVGTVCLGAGISLTAQVFHLSGKWNGWMLLWSLGAAAGYQLIRDWLQLLLLAILVPLWVTAEWDVRVQSGHIFLPQTCLWLGLSAIGLVGRDWTDSNNDLDFCLE